MAAGATTLGGAADMGKGLCGYRKSDVQQLLADRDTMLRQAEKRIRARILRPNSYRVEKLPPECPRKRLRRETARIRRQLRLWTARTIKAPPELLPFT